MNRKATLAVLAIACAASISGCEVTRTISSGEIESEIARGIEEQTGTAVEVSCPEDVEVEVGRTFTCTATSEGGTSRDVRVTWSDEEGDFRWELE
jgi:Domain of unknown function (DUF4333)